MNSEGRVITQQPPKCIDKQNKQYKVDEKSGTKYPQVTEGIQ